MLDLFYAYLLCYLELYIKVFHVCFSASKIGCLLKMIGLMEKSFKDKGSSRVYLKYILEVSLSFIIEIST